VSLRQEALQRIKFSLRSWGEIDVRAIAASFGGGGHHNASGGIIEKDLFEAEKIIVQAVQESLVSSQPVLEEPH
jgi:phosphoesterase RecJ-like protein